MADDIDHGDAFTRYMKAAGWTEEKLAEYRKERDDVTMRSLGDRIGTVDPRTGKPRRVERFEGAAYGWNPQDYWRHGGGNRNNKTED